MSEWRECALSSVATSNNHSIGKNYTYETIQYLDTGSITNGKIEGYQEVKLSEAPSRAKRLVKHEDIIYSTVRPIQRHYGFIQNPIDTLVVSTGFSVIEVDKKLANPKFIYYFLSSNEIVEALDVIAEASTTTYPSLKPKDIEDLDIYLPPLEEQKTIAEVLSSLDDKIDLLHRQNKTLEELAQTLFRQWFIEEAREGWEVGTFADLVDVASGKSLKRELFDDNGEYEVLGANGKIGKTHEWLFNEELIYTGRVGTLGNIFLIDEAKKVWLSDNTLVVKPKKYFYFIYFLMIDFQLENLNVGSTQPLVRQSDLKNIEISLPDNELIIKFENQSKNIFSKINENKKQIQTLENLRDTLLPKLMSGEVRVEG